VTLSGVDADRFRQLLGRFATGVTVVTTRTADGHPIGMTASSVASLSLDPPLVLVCVDRANDMHAALEAARHFVLNILAVDQETLSRRFASETENRFDGVGFSDSEHGVPVLEGIVGSIECEKQQCLPGGDHSIFVGLVTGGSAQERHPLLYYRGGYDGLR
jgi:flavin reductase (DIM6/NTAB) family NADH-FMN oxidoreductase RutF